MRRLLALTGLVLLALVPAQAFAHGGAEITVKGDVQANGPITINGEGFEEKAIVHLSVQQAGRPESIPLGIAEAGEQGDFEVTFHLPESVSPGMYTLVAQGGDDEAEFDLTVLEATQAAPKATAQAEEQPVSGNRSGGETAGLVALTAVFALAGLGLLWLSRTGHPASPPSAQA